MSLRVKLTRKAAFDLAQSFVSLKHESKYKAERTESRDECAPVR
jgi:hypothetical protein